MDAYNAFAPIGTTSVLGTNEVPEHYPVSIGQPSTLSLRGVVGFGNIVLMIMRTVDAELTRTAGAEIAFRARWQIARHQLPGHVNGTDRVINKTLKRMHLPRIQDEWMLYKWIKENNLV